MKLFAYVIVVLIGGSVLAGGISDTHLPRRASALPEGLIPPPGATHARRGGREAPLHEPAPYSLGR
jgi:hypothetical protein